ncbi:hypothetical protein [Peptoanaerobacter stomatis]|uniref:hypothetical protein n=1 Tax=Peptoanaerobacter stomatis TaxID=796937 RepID=UPI00030A32E4|nr:hypothetical protein [Peptoanaerobacter stomatis]
METIKGKIKGNIIFPFPSIRENKGRIRERKLLGCECRNRQTQSSGGCLIQAPAFCILPYQNLI